MIKKYLLLFTIFRSQSNTQICELLCTKGEIPVCFVPLMSTYSQIMLLDKGHKVLHKLISV